MYWYPLYAFARGRGLGREDAEDLIQGFFQHVYERDLMAKAEPSRGKLRAFLLVSLKNFLSQERKKESALKRGGAFSFVSAEAESGSLVALDDRTLSPDMLYERCWGNRCWTTCSISFAMPFKVFSS